MRWVLVAFLALHGVAHVVGFISAWRLSKHLPAMRTVVGGRLDLGQGGIRLVGVGWLLVALGFAGVAIATALSLPGWLPAAAVVAVASLILSGLWWPEARVGVYVNAVLLALFLGYVASGRYLP